MSGLFIFIGERDPDVLGRHATRLGGHASETFSRGPLYVHATDNPARGSQAESPRTFVYLYGALYLRTGNDAAHVLERFEADGPRSLEQLNGSFIAVVLDIPTNTVWIVNDRSGSILAYVREHADHALALTTQCKVLFGLDDFTPAIDVDTIAAHMMFGRVKLTQNPFFTGVSPLRPASLVKAGAGTVSTSRYYQYRDRSRDIAPLPDAAEHAASVLSTIMSERIEAHDHLAFSLSGGIDSRVMLATIPRALADRFVAVSFGMAGNDESAIAKQVAEACAVPYIDVEMTPRDFLADAVRTTEVSEGQDMFLQGFVFRFLDNLRRDHGVDAIMDGMEVGVSLGGDYLKPSFHDVAPAHLRDFIFDRFYNHKQPPEEIYRFDARRAAHRLIDGVLAEIADIESVYDKMDWFYVECYTREVMRQRHRLTRQVLEGIPIAVDTRYLDLVTTLAPSLKEGRKVQLEILRQRDPRFLDIPYHLTMVPLGASAEDWAAGKARVAAREAHAQDAWRTSRTHIPYNHYYTNFAEWLRVDPDMLAFTGDLLLTETCRVSQQIVQRDWMLQVIREHQEGSADHRSTIQYLLTVELFLRRFGST